MLPSGDRSGSRDGSSRQDPNLRAADGSLAVDEQVEPELQQLYVQKSSQQYLLTATRLPRPSHRAEFDECATAQRSACDPFTDRRRADLCVRRRDGKTLWKGPASVHKYCMPLDQPVESPVLALLRHVSVSGQNSSRRTMTATLLCLDKRDGREVLNKEDLSTVQTFEMVARRSDATVIVSLNTGNFTFKLTDDPIDPQPPVQTKDPTASLDSIGRKIAGAILDVLSSGGEAGKAGEGDAVKPPAVPVKPGDKAQEAKRRQSKETEKSAPVNKPTKTPTTNKRNHHRKFVHDAISRGK